MNYPSPRTPGSTPIHDWEYSRMSSATPTPSPRPNWLDSSTPRRPATRAAHTRSSSYSQHGGLTPRTHLESPRYNSQGDYCTVDVSAKDFPSSRRTSAQYQTPPRRDRRHSYTYARASTPYGESDEDEIIETMGGTFMLPAQSRFKSRHTAHVSMYDGGWYTNQGTHPQGSPYYADPGYARASPYDSPYQPPPQARPARPPTSHGHARRSSASVPQRPSTVRPPTTSHRPRPPPTPAKATEADAKRHRIPAGYQLKNWDPNEEPILLLGSVFDANSLGKWIYDWTVYAHGASSPIADISGDLWLLLLELAGKMKRLESVVGRVRTEENREEIKEYIAAGERLNSKLQSLLKACEAPMLKAAKKKSSGLGNNSGVEFVNTLFGRERELGKTEKFMQGVRTFSLRYEANCEDIIRNPAI
ncbi:hypothetical protein QQS21_004428 [Conoideocrella luteorostrata]|uniref:Vegetative cell wall protein gp1 n=1 Tax=Conoideocrella luteorostrata TaxID=1105319 RepID=A0AAJ0CRD0_9HYPO|nr:hypothetical protein QQS21_004428 [Conoideocrella luteorostrata]